MKRVVFASTILFVLVSAGCTATGDQIFVRPVASSTLPPSPSPSPSPTPEVAAFLFDRAVEHARALSVDIGKRTSGSEGERRAAEYISQAMAASGLEVTRQQFERVDGGTSENIVGRINGADYSGGYVVVGGHFDTKGESPGGNDNGSGVGVVLALGEAFARSLAPIEFVAFAAEEFHPVTKKHHEGSLHYTQSLRDPKIVSAMVSVDMVGNGPSVLLARWRNGSDGAQKELAAVAGEFQIPFKLASRGDISDHTSFERIGVTAALVWSGDHPSLHTAADTFEVVQPEAVDRAGRLVFEWLRRRQGM